MPSAERVLSQHGIKPESVEATGPGGRILKEDVQRKVSEKNSEKPQESSSTSAPAPASPAQKPAPGSRAEEIVPMTRLRRTLADRLVQAQHNAALLTTFNEVDMSGIMALRKEYQEAFVAKYGVKLGFMSFFVKAVIEGLKLIPQVNAEIRGSDVVYHNYFDIGVAVGGGRGLVVPVVRNAERLSFAEIEITIADLGKRAKENKLKLEELQGGTFTVSNGGVYGSLLSTPIINPPQSGILGMHAIQDRPVARDGQVVIRPMMYLALTYDHRIVDGREAVTFLKRVKEVIENPTRILLEV
jgi:2-oxoglutarate dehydrogenase E2 component (dihydrolipoamide succinyltransferase)